MESLRCRDVWGQGQLMPSCNAIQGEFYKLFTILFSNFNMARATKGIKKRLKTKFKIGNTHGQKRLLQSKSIEGDSKCSDNCKWARYDQDDYAYLVKSSPDGQQLGVQRSDGSMLDTKVLRPRPPAPSSSSRPGHVRSEDVPPPAASTPEDIDTYRILHMQKTEDLWNEAIDGHRDLNLSCKGHLHWDYTAERSQGLCWTERLRCEACSYVSPFRKLFVDIRTGKRGRPAGDLNIKLQIGLSHTMISNTAMQKILATCEVPPPSTSSMQHQANYVGDKVTELNKTDMANLRKKVKDMNEMKGLERNSGIRGAIDSKYNTKLSSAKGKTPFQPSSQSSTTLVEHESGQNWIIGLHVTNKLCSRCSRTRKEGEDVCQHEGTCSANVPLSASIGDEYAAARTLMSEIRDEPESAVNIRYVTSDADSRAARGIEDAQGENIVHLLDTRHFGESVRRSLERMKFSAGAIPGSTVREREGVQKRFAQNLTQRVNAEWKIAYKLHSNNLHVLKNKLSYAIDAIIECYNGNCGRSCAKHSMVCDGKHKSKKQWQHGYLDRDMAALAMNPDDKQQVRGAVMVRLGSEGVDRTKFNTNTQFVEAAHRSYTSCNPQQVTMSRNAPARLHSAVHKLNHGIEMSTRKKCQFLGAPIKEGTRAARALKRMDKERNQRREHQKTQKAKSKRRSRIRGLYALHRQKREDKCYEKDLILHQVKATQHDHDYLKVNRGRSKKPEHQEHPYALRTNRKRLDI